MLSLLLQLAVWVIIIGGFVWYGRWAIKKRYDTSAFQAASGAIYTYVVGDRLHYGYTSGIFNGIDIILPKTLPHIYLDGKSGHAQRGTHVYFEAKQAMHLEGDFNKYFAVYVPRDYERMVLSILTPDVMQTLIEQVPEADVEVYLDHIRIIVDHKVHDRPAVVAALTVAAEAILAEVDWKLRSWSDADAEQARQAVLVSQNMPTVALFGRRFRFSSVIMGPLYGFLGLFMWLFTVSALRRPPRVTIGWIISTFWIPFLFFPCIWLFVIYVVPSRWFAVFMDTISRQLDRWSAPRRRF